MQLSPDTPVTMFVMALPPKVTDWRPDQPPIPRYSNGTAPYSEGKVPQSSSPSGNGVFTLAPPDQELQLLEDATAALDVDVEDTSTQDEAAAEDFWKKAAADGVGAAVLEGAAEELSHRPAGALSAHFS